MNALDVLEEMIVEEAEIACKMAIAFPHDFDRLSAGAGAGIRLRALCDAKRRLQRERTLELENEIKKG